MNQENNNKMGKGIYLITITSIFLWGFIIILCRKCNAVQEFSVEGRVYCDTCRLGFETSLSYPIAGARLMLKCKNGTTNVTTLKMDGESEKSGSYKIVVTDGNHADEVCEISLMESRDPECSEVLKDVVHFDIVTLKNKGEATQVDGYTNPLGFATKKAAENCSKGLFEMGVLPLRFFDQ